MRMAAGVEAVGGIPILGDNQYKKDGMIGNLKIKSVNITPYGWTLNISGGIKIALDRDFINQMMFHDNNIILDIEFLKKIKKIIRKKALEKMKGE